MNNYKESTKKIEKVIKKINKEGSYNNTFIDKMCLMSGVSPKFVKTIIGV